MGVANRSVMMMALLVVFGGCNKPATGPGTKTVPEEDVRGMYPHAKNWVLAKNHGAHFGKLKNESKNACVSCHMPREGFSPEITCKACHLRMTPHDGGSQSFLARHIGLARKPEATCKSCHAADAFSPKGRLGCVDCHHGNEWKLPENHGVHFKNATTENQTACLDCHRKHDEVSPAVTCAGCHKKAKPHVLEDPAEEFIYDHMNVDRASCKTCHALPLLHPMNLPSCSNTGCHKDSAKAITAPARKLTGSKAKKKPRL